jgi:hypothetical protein
MNQKAADTKLRMGYRKGRTTLPGLLPASAFHVYAYAMPAGLHQHQGACRIAVNRRDKRTYA